jgi:signal transduction histidine kinase
MIHFEQVQLFGLGMAAAIDTALLLVLVDRHNWRRVMLPLVNLVSGAWLLHVALFVCALIEETPGTWATGVHWVAMLAMTAGLLLMPSALLHALLRLSRSGFDTGTARRLPHALAYLPLLALAPCAWWFWTNPRVTPLALPSAAARMYIVWLGVINVVAATGMLRLKGRMQIDRAPSFLAMTATTLVGLAALHALVFLYVWPRWPQWREPFFLALVLSPVVLESLFAYFVLRFKFMHIVLEQTIAYGLMTIVAVLFYRIFMRNVWSNLNERFHVDCAIIATVFLCMLILTYRPLRQRTAESLRYLMGERVARIRERTRQLSIDMSTLTGQPPLEILGWFCDSACRALGVSFAGAWLLDGSDEVAVRGGASDRLVDESTVRIHREMADAGLVSCGCRSAPTQFVEDALHAAGASLAVRLNHPNVAGLVLLGSRQHRWEMSEEQMIAVTMLVEQLGVTLNSSQMQADRIAAERRALQQEKLSTLGLLASSIAHEVKNPLSSIKTIATVLREEIDPVSGHAEDVRLILGEVDRLSATVTKLLQVARPSESASQQANVAEVISDTLRLMRHLAAQQGVTIESQVPADLPLVPCNENAVREVFLNLLSNSIDAAGQSGRVSVSARRDDGRLVVGVSDTGPGIPPECQDRLFEPFVTTKQNGTGLGLYVVGCRMREIGGEIRCHTSEGSGTTFVVSLPVCNETR